MPDTFVNDPEMAKDNLLHEGSNNDEIVNRLMEVIRKSNAQNKILRKILKELNKQQKENQSQDSGPIDNSGHFEDATEKNNPENKY